MSVHSSLDLYLLCLLILLATFSQTCHATDYFVSSSTGADSNSGSDMSQPWQSINKVNSGMSGYQSGDTINFCQGDRWTLSSLQLSALGMTYQSYNCHPGVTSMPQITPSRDLLTSGWTRWSQNNQVLIYDMTNDANALASGVAALWTGTTRYSLARWPNMQTPDLGTTWGVSRNEYNLWNSLNGVAIDAPQITANFSNNFFQGAQIHFRACDWLWFSNWITASSNNSLTINTAWSQQDALLYFLEANPNGANSNHLWMLDNIGEYAYDQTSNKLYLYPMSNSVALDILKGNVNVTILYSNAGTAATMSSTSYFSQIYGIEFTQANTAILINAMYVGIYNSAFTHSLAYGINVPNAEPYTYISNNRVDDIEGTCINTVGSTVNIVGNTISNCGMWARWNPAYWNGITLTGGLAQGNSLLNIGYNAINPHAGATVDSNVMINSMMTLNDGGAIYLYGQTDSYAVITNNVISGVLGNYVSYNFGFGPLSPCMYFDQNSYFVRAENNTCSNAQQCFQLNYSFNHSLLMNACQAPGIHISGGGGHLIAGNLMVSHGTNDGWQNPLMRLDNSEYSTLAPILTVWDQLYCIAVPNGGYMFQAGTSLTFWRVDDFPSYKNPGSVNNPNFELGSVSVTSCDSYQPVDIYASDPWAFLNATVSSSSSSSSSTGAALSSSALSSSSSSSSSSSLPSSSSSSSSSPPPSSSSSSSSPLSSSSSSSSSSIILSSSVISSSSSMISSTSIMPTSMPVDYSSSSSSILASSSSGFESSSSSSSSGGPIGSCNFTGVITQPAAAIFFYFTIPSLQSNTGDLLLQDIDQWFIDNMNVSIYEPASSPPTGLQCGFLYPLTSSLASTRRLLSTTSALEAEILLLALDNAADLAQAFAAFVSNNGFTASRSGATLSNSASAWRVCRDGTYISTSGTCDTPVSSSSSSSSSGSSAPASSLPATSSSTASPSSSSSSIDAPTSAPFVTSSSSSTNAPTSVPSATSSNPVESSSSAAPISYSSSSESSVVVSSSSSSSSSVACSSSSSSSSASGTAGPGGGSSESSSSAGITAMLGPIVGAIVGVVFAVILSVLGYRYYRRKQIERTARFSSSNGTFPWLQATPSPTASPTLSGSPLSTSSSSPDFFAMRNSPSMSPTRHTENGLPMSSFSLNDPAASPTSKQNKKEKAEIPKKKPENLEIPSSPQMSFTLSPSQSNRPFLSPPSPLMSSSSNTSSSYSPSSSSVFYQSMGPPSPLMRPSSSSTSGIQLEVPLSPMFSSSTVSSSQLRVPPSPMSPLSPIQPPSGNNSSPSMTSYTEYARLPPSPLQLPVRPMGRPFNNRAGTDKKEKETPPPVPALSSSGLKHFAVTREKEPEDEQPVKAPTFVAKQPPPLLSSTLFGRSVPPPPPASAKPSPQTASSPRSAAPLLSIPPPAPPSASPHSPRTVPPQPPALLSTISAYTSTSPTKKPPPPPFRG